MQFNIQKFLVIFLLVFIASPVFAASLSFESKTQVMAIGQEIELDVFIDSSDESINAIGGKIIFPQDLLELKNINDGNSVISFWVEQPKAVLDGQIEFSGIVPGGYNASHAKLFSIIFLAKTEGFAKIDFKDIKILRNDGQGTEASVSISNSQFQILNLPSNDLAPITSKKTDITPPEKFVPQIEFDEAIFDGQWFLVFNAQDKGSGIDHYEVCEGKRKCIVASSPYLLQNQYLDEEIIVKAIDKSGNERIVKLLENKEINLYKKYYSIVLSIFILLLLSYFSRKYLRKK